MRWPVFLLIWLKLIFSESDVAGNRATGQVTRERRKNPFQLARGAMKNSQRNRSLGFKLVSPESFRLSKRKVAPLCHSLAICSLLVLVENDHCLKAGDRVS